MEEFSGEFELINPVEISIDHRYQRQQKEPLIAVIGSTFKWSSFGALTCVRRNGVVYAVDGQQRLAAAMTQKPRPKVVPCIVFAEEDLKKEAQSFLDIQINRKAVSAIEKHTAQLVAKDESALAIQRAVDQAGFTISPYSASSSNRNVFAVRALHYAYDLLAEDGVLQVLTQVRDAWPDEQGGTEAGMIKLIADVIFEQGEKYERAKFTTALSRTTPSQLQRRANGFMADAGGSRKQNLRRALKALARV